MAQPWFEVQHLARSAGLIALSANFELYGDMSSRMMALAARYAPRQEVYSIDECFLDFEACRATGRRRARRCAPGAPLAGLPTSVGFGPTKTLAKLANHVAKTAERKPGSYPRRWRRSATSAPAPASARRGDAPHRRRRRLGHRPQDRAEAARRRHPHRARPPARRRDRPGRQLGIVCRRPCASCRARRASGRRRPAGAAADPVLALVRQPGDGAAGAHRGRERLRHPRGPSAAGAARRLQRVQVFIATSPWRKQIASTRRRPPCPCAADLGHARPGERSR
jgi:hypothetical protein